jgi:hypothetical protein
MTEPVVSSNQEQLTMGGCLGILGFESAKEFWEHHPLYHTWKFKGWASQFGNRAPPDRGKALLPVKGSPFSYSRAKQPGVCSSGAE